MAIKITVFTSNIKLVQIVGTRQVDGFVDGRLGPANDAVKVGRTVIGLWHIVARVVAERSNLFAAIL